jgi:hypothetical protein
MKNNYMKQRRANMSEYSSGIEKNENAALKWNRNIALAIPGWIALAGGISSIQRFVLRWGNDPNYSSFVDNWFPWIAVLFFVTGWLAAHGIEIALLQRKLGVARILTVTLLFGLLIIIPWTVSIAISNPIVHEIDALTFLGVSAYFFRYSLYQKDALHRLPSVYFGGK